ncbi:sigma-70 family RNA polymerase sigma factor [Gimesia fumaroli]|uniref:RNA polymerase sigma factor SigM n=1 Tax=Gimesia fumaroli TaxID=2527976 RepID=A0A518IA10_9PLAN|nr:sigma-70 family RNA polymerase sigma factor [Gimesia fumaroli]QDV49849.1 RNA polymerase sigma factor SigM [Gimesia fumaroli]
MDNSQNLKQETSRESNQELLQAQSRELLARNWMKAQPSLLAFIVSSTPQFSDAEDLLHEVAAEVALRFNQYDQNRPFLPWALWVAKMKIADFYRSKKRTPVVFVGESIDAVAEVCTRVQLNLDEEKGALENCLSQLTDRSRELLHLRYTQEMKPQDISEKLGLTPGSVRVSLSRIRSALTQCVKNILSRKQVTNG